MISKERLEELIKQGATIYDIFQGDIWLVDLTMAKYYDVPKYIEYKNNYYNCNLTRSNQDLFETKEDAEFALKYQNITRTETLSLPTWEELFTKTEHQIEIDNFHAFMIDMPYKKDNGRIVIAEYNEFKECYIMFDKLLTKENYLKACELCRKLFLGENDDK